MLRCVEGKKWFFWLFLLGTNECLLLGEAEAVGPSWPAHELHHLAVRQRAHAVLGDGRTDGRLDRGAAEDTELRHQRRRAVRKPLMYRQVHALVSIQLLNKPSMDFLLKK